jgi:cell division protein FtsI (penicillin-binding protein 3)/stage V sporulation protein D (sporulation-specific penicillin-binding protein)
MTNVLELSLNTGAVFMEQTVGHDKFREYVKKFGFGERTGVDLQGEVLGDIRNITDTSRDINFATASFGQGIAVTPIQIVAAFSAFANGGKMVNPHVNKGVKTEIIGEPISPKTAALVTNMLVSAVENGYGKKARVLGYKVAGKSGTAQVPNEEKGGYLEDKTIHSFIGFAPAYDPRFIALVKLDNPKGINFSSDSIAPLFSEIAEYILNYYEIPPS